MEYLGFFEVYLKFYCVLSVWFNMKEFYRYNSERIRYGSI